MASRWMSRRMSRSRASVHSLSTLATSLAETGPFNRATYCSGGNSVCRSRNCSRRRRLSALRSTAVRANFLPIISPSCGRIVPSGEVGGPIGALAAPGTAGVAARRYTQSRRPRCARVFSARTKSSDSSSRAARGKAKPASTLHAAQNALPRYGSSRQDSAAFGATGADHTTTALGFHTGTETVVALAADNGRLECTFHSGKSDFCDACRLPASQTGQRGAPPRRVNLRKSLEL